MPPSWRQSNFCGRRYPLDWAEQLRSGQLYIKPCRSGSKTRQWHVLLDAASFVSTARLDLSATKPDFVCVSFYKLFGLPSGVGALLVRKDRWVGKTNIAASCLPAASLAKQTPLSTHSSPPSGVSVQAPSSSRSTLEAGHQVCTAVSNDFINCAPPWRLNWRPARFPLSTWLHWRWASSACYRCLASRST